MRSIMFIVTNFPGNIYNNAAIFSTRTKAEHFVKTHISGYCEISFMFVDPTDDELFNGISKDEIHDSEDYPLRFVDGCPLKKGECSPIKKYSEDYN